MVDAVIADAVRIACVGAALVAVASRAAAADPDVIVAKAGAEAILVWRANAALAAFSADERKRPRFAIALAGLRRMETYARSRTSSDVTLRVVAVQSADDARYGETTMSAVLQLGTLHARSADLIAEGKRWEASLARGAAPPGLDATIDQAAVGRALAP